jgi:hypothetical protein
MEVVEVTHSEYTRLIPSPFHVFGTANFNQINEDKCETVFYLLFKDSKYRLGLIGGIRNKVFCSPFSAPFGGFSFLQSDIRISAIDEALVALQDWALLKGLSSIKITLPPTIYHESFLAKQTNSLYRHGYSIDKIDLNYAYPLSDFSEEYPASIWYNARKNLKIALANDFSFHVCTSIEQKEQAYEVIKQNRAARGFPLRMTWQQVQTSASVMQADYFLVHNTQQIAVAAAIVFHVSKDIVQVIYWGDLPEFAALKTMNFLSYKVFDYYHQTQVRIIDIGPSTEDSIPNFGLCEFKEGIGCTISSKYSFIKQLQ